MVTFAKLDGIAQADIAKYMGQDMPSGGGAWTPADLTSLFTWHDASDSSTITVTGSNVSEWADKSGNGISLTDGWGGLGPTVATADQNGLDSLYFSGSTLLRNSTAWNNAGTIDFSVAALFKFTGTISTTGRGVVFIGPYVSNGAIHMAVRSDLTNNFRSYTTSNGSADGVGYNPVSSVSANTIYSAITHRAAGDGGTWINGTPASETGDPAAQSTFGASSGYFMVGAYFDTGYKWIGNIYEVVATKAKMTPTERANLLAYWTSKWGL